MRFIRSIHMYGSYFFRVMGHKRNVMRAGLEVGGIPIARLIFHDMSKFSPSEFPQYARYFLGGRSTDSMDDFTYAWNHHAKSNPHHWEYWILNENYNFGRAVNGKIPMPEDYVREMVADWMGASKSYTGSWDMSDWLSGNLANIKTNMHMATATRLDRVLCEIGYVEQEDGSWQRQIAGAQ